MSEPISAQQGRMPVILNQSPWWPANFEAGDHRQMRPSDVLLNRQQE
jgi:hypothetical protein